MDRDPAHRVNDALRAFEPPRADLNTVADRESLTPTVRGIVILVVLQIVVLLGLSLATSTLVGNKPASLVVAVLAPFFASLLFGRAQGWRPAPYRMRLATISALVWLALYWTLVATWAGFSAKRGLWSAWFVIFMAVAAILMSATIFGMTLLALWIGSRRSAPPAQTAA